MRWQEARETYVDQWLVAEVLDAATCGGRRMIEQVRVLELCPDGRSAMKRYAMLRRVTPQRDLIFAHTTLPELAIEERTWIGTRGIHAGSAPR